MAQASSPAATVHPGRIQSIFDHLILSLKADPEGAEPDFLLSHWSYRWSTDGLAGNLAYLQATIYGTARHLILTDAPELADRYGKRMAPRAWSEADVEGDMVFARFERIDDWPDAVRERIWSDGLELEVAWSGLAPPMFAQGPAPRSPEQDIVSVLFEATEATATIDGSSVEASPFPNDVWVSWLGRPLSSCVVALGEVLLTRPAPAA